MKRLCHNTDSGPYGYRISQGIKRQKQHYEMMTMAEELARLLMAQSWPQILPQAMAFVRVSLPDKSICLHLTSQLIEPPSIPPPPY